MRALTEQFTYLSFQILIWQICFPPHPPKTRYICFHICFQKDFEIWAILSYPPRFWNTAKPLGHVDLADSTPFGWSHRLAPWWLETPSQIFLRFSFYSQPSHVHTTVALSNDNGALFRVFRFQKDWLGVQALYLHWTFMLLFSTNAISSLLKLAQSHITAPPRRCWKLA